MEPTNSGGDVFLQEHVRLSRRYFLQAGMTATAGWAIASQSVWSGEHAAVPPKPVIEPSKAGASGWAVNMTQCYGPSNIPA
jgi:hypothetical protein